jgi:O-glycosyl hydrolase
MTRIVIFAAMLAFQTLGAATVTFNGGVTYQTIEGFGANINHRSWTNDDLKPVIDALVDQAGMTLFRVVYDKTDWEATNENASPYVMNWAYYDQVYSSAEFEKMWGLVGYLNQKGISNGVMFNFQGNGPAWLGSPALKTGMEPEWAQMVASLLIYARQTNHLQFGLVGPDNEMDQTVQGVNMTATQYVTALHDLSQLLDTNGLSDLRFVGPDLAGGGTTYMPQMLADPVVMSKVAHFGLHSYSGGGSGSAGVASYIESSAYPDRTVWMTEFGVWCAPCDAGVSGTDSWSYASAAVDYLSGHLANGVTAGLVWEGYDSQWNYYNPGQWDFWGLFAVDNTNAVDKTYTPRKIFYTLSQVSKWVRPGAQMIGVSGSVSSLSPLLAFNNAGLGQVTIVGINTSGSAATLNGALVSLPTVPYLDLYYTSATTNLANGGSVAVNNGTFSATIPANSVFTLTGFTGVNVTLTNPVNGAQFNAPATIPLGATATSAAGSIALVWFYNGVTELGEATSAPYGFTWNNVPMGNYALSAVAGDSLGNVGTSAVVNVTVVGPLAQIGVTPANASVAPGGQQQFSATGTDLLDHTLVPQPAFVWSVSGGGTIDGTGLFTAGSGAGGPFNVVAASGGITGEASVRVAAVSGGTIGNMKEGTSTDTLWDNGAWINLGRFQAGSNMVVSTMFAKVGAVSGGYKCAIYTDKSGTPSAFLGGTAEVEGPTNGWNVFPLTSPVTLTNGLYYWLAIWSDDASAKVYYSDSSGTLRWGQYNYGTWPNPISTTGGSTLDYCIYARGGAVPTLGSVSVTPANGVVLIGSSVQFTATGTYSDGSLQNLTSQATWGSSNTGVAGVTAGGLATGVSAGTTIISAALAGVSNSTVLTVKTPPTLTSIVVTPANPTNLAGATRQFTATGTYSDSSTQNITSQATWTSSSTGVATINASGLATAVSGGVTTISAALAGVAGGTTLTVQTPPTLASIAMTPVNPAIVVGATQQFTAMGTYSDGSTQNLSNRVTWTSSKTAVATINTNGLAAGVSAGATVISAALSGVTATNTLTVQAAPLVMTTTSMPAGTVSVAYSAAVSATGGTTPYTWSIASGSLPGGLALKAASGTITGTPTNTGTFTFTARVSDAGSPQQIASNALSITISSAPTSKTIWPSTIVPGTADSGPDSAVELGVKFKSDVAGRITGIRFYKATANTGTHVSNLWSSAGTKLATATFSGETASGWQQVSFATPVAITSNTVYVASYHCTVGHYSEDDNYFASKGVDNPPLHALANGVSGGNGVYAYGTSSAFPNSTWNAANYWVDVVFAVSSP